MTQSLFYIKAGDAYSNRRALKSGHQSVNKPRERDAHPIVSMVCYQYEHYPSVNK